MGGFRDLDIVKWAGLVVRENASAPMTFGGIVDESAIPAGTRRRMGKLERIAVRCALGVLDDEPPGELIFCSRYGNLETLESLLTSLAGNELLSPMAFSGSVHNAAPGFVGQIRKERLSHTAISAGASTLSAGLVEALARLTTRESDNVVLIYVETKPPEIYRELDGEIVGDIGIALRLMLSAECGEGTVVGDGWNGALALLDAMQVGERHLTLGSLS
jgi:hypothetical protein